MNPFSAKERQKKMDEQERKALNLKKQKAMAKQIRKQKKKSTAQKVDDDFWGD